MSAQLAPAMPSEAETPERVSAPGWAFRATDLRIAYEGKTVLEDVELEIMRRRITALIGPSGCGKTTFLQSLNRLTDMIPRCTVDGSLLLGDRVLGEHRVLQEQGAGELDLGSKELDVVSLRRRVGMIFQRPNPFPLSIRRNLELPLKEHGFKDPELLRRKIERSLRDVGLWDEVAGRLDQTATALSGGQQQRLCLARALVLEPEILLMDEPTSALDPLAAAVVEDLIQSLRDRYTIVIVTHNLAQARRLADDVAVFWVREGTGRVIEKGPVAQIFDRPQDPDTEAYVRGLRG